MEVEPARGDEKNGHLNPLCLLFAAAAKQMPSMNFQAANDLLVMSFPPNGNSGNCSPNTFEEHQIGKA